MKAILLALTAGLLLLAIGTWRLRRQPGGGAATLLRVFLAILPVLAIVHLLTPASLGILPPSLQIQIPAIDFLFSLFLCAAGFFGGVLQLYNLADRGFSLRILIDILHAPSHTMALDNVMTGYSEGRGIAWMYGKRIDGMKATGIAKVDGDKLALTARGRSVARLFSRLRTFARIDEDLP